MKTIAYLLSEYPTLGHTYILREVCQLREMGWPIQTLSIRKPPRHPSELSSAEREEWNSTWYILASDPVEFLKANLVTFATRPRRYLSGLRTALGFGRCSLRDKARSLAYFAEAVLAGSRMQSAGIEHVHSVYTSTVALILSRIFDVRLSLTIHGPSEFFDAEGFHLREKIAAAELVTGISSYCRSQIMLWAARDDWSKIEVVPLGIDIGNWKQAPFREPSAPFNLISVGRLNEVKGYPLLLQAVASLLAQGKDVRLRLVGDGPEAQRLRDLAQQLGIAERVFFEGWKNQAELRQLYADSDLCVMSSFSEGVPVVLMEAMAMGIPCVAPRITGIPELIRDGVEGLLVTPANVGELTAAIAKMIERPDLRRHMGEACPRRISDCYNLSKNVHLMSDLFTRKTQLELPAARASS